jgi:hypothetical protein
VCHKQGRGGFVHDGAGAKDQVGRLLPGAARQLPKHVDGVVAAIRKLKEGDSAGGTSGDHLGSDFEVAMVKDGHESDFDDPVQDFKA